MTLIGFNNKGSGFLFGYEKDVKPLPSEEYKQLLEDIELLKWFKNMDQSIFTIDEYPKE